MTQQTVERSQRTITAVQRYAQLEFSTMIGNASLPETVESGNRRRVIRQHERPELAGPLGQRMTGKLLEQPAPNTASLPVIGYSHSRSATTAPQRT